VSRAYSEVRLQLRSYDSYNSGQNLVLKMAWSDDFEWARIVISAKRSAESAAVNLGVSQRLVIICHGHVRSNNAQAADMTAQPAAGVAERREYVLSWRLSRIYHLE